MGDTRQEKSAWEPNFCRRHLLEIWYHEAGGQKGGQTRLKIKDVRLETEENLSREPNSCRRHSLETGQPGGGEEVVDGSGVDKLLVAGVDAVVPAHRPLVVEVIRVQPNLQQGKKSVVRFVFSAG